MQPLFRRQSGPFAAQGRGRLFPLVADRLWRHFMTALMAPLLVIATATASRSARGFPCEFCGHDTQFKSVKQKGVRSTFDIHQHRQQIALSHLVVTSGQGRASRILPMPPGGQFSAVLRCNGAPETREQ